MATEGFIERRKCQRFRVKDGAFAVLRSGSDTLGQIKDMSTDRLAFDYLANKQHLEGPLDLDILDENGFCVKQLRSITVLNFAVSNKSPFSPLIVMRCGVKFGELMPTYIKNMPPGTPFAGPHAQCSIIRRNQRVGSKQEKSEKPASSTRDRPGALSVRSLPIGSRVDGWWPDHDRGAFP